MTNIPARVAYLEKAIRGFNLAIVAGPCNGPAYINAPRVPVADKKAARAYCKANGIKPWNF